MDTNIHIRVQSEDVSVTDSYAALREFAGGAVCMFVGLVRDLPQGGLIALQIEHFPKMAERQLGSIATQAAERWPLHAICIVHRYGRLAAGEQIILVGCASDHREPALAACSFIMDYVKTDAPFWKKVIAARGESWVQAKASDAKRRRGW